MLHSARDALVRAGDIGSDLVPSRLGTDRMTIQGDAVRTPVNEVGDRLGCVPIGEDHRCTRRWDHGFDPLVAVRESAAGGLIRAATAGVR